MVLSSLAVYVQVGSAGGAVRLGVQWRVGSGSSGGAVAGLETRLTRRWVVRLTQLRARDEGAAPTGCLQYHDGHAGLVQSFGYLGPGPGSYTVSRRGLVHGTAVCACLEMDWAGRSIPRSVACADCVANVVAEQPQLRRVHSQGGGLLQRHLHHRGRQRYDHALPAAQRGPR